MFNDKLFQSTHPRRVWLRYCLFLLWALDVSIHTPTKGVTISCRLLVRLTACFNPHTHEGCDFGFCYHKHGTFGFQSTHPRRVWRKLESQNVVNNSVSIHTPTKGVTHLFCLHVRVSDVSIHTPTKGVTIITILNFLILLFQSTHPRRVWPLMQGRAALTNAFQSTHPRRVWLHKPILIGYHVSFNPHTHEGCDLRFKLFNANFNCFNPHTHEGCDLVKALAATSYWVSIHTPTKGVTSMNTLYAETAVVSIHTPTKGVTTSDCRPATL